VGDDYVLGPDGYDLVDDMGDDDISDVGDDE
jgi:hypothetical protein